MALNNDESRTKVELFQDRERRDAVAADVGAMIWDCGRDLRNLCICFLAVCQAPVGHSPGVQRITMPSV